MLEYVRPTRVVRRHYIGNGLVGCPIQGADVDVEECLRCLRLREVVRERRPYVVCEGVPREMPRPILELVPPHGS